MPEGWLDVVGCPHCRSPFSFAAEEARPLRCRGCDQAFVLDGPIPVLLRSEDAERLVRFSQDYCEARLAEGWQPLAPEQARALPYGDPAGYPPLYWRVRRQSFCALMRLLARAGPSPAAGPAADLGAGVGWLSYRLAQVGYSTLAVEASRDAAFGLGAAEVYYAGQPRFWPVRGDLEHPPLQVGRLGLVVYNASLHYAADLAGALHRAAEALRPGGCLIVLDTPVARQPRPGSGRGDRHLGRQELDAALAGNGLHPRWIQVRRGLPWLLYQVKVWLKREPRFSFPLVVADKA